MTRKPGIPTTPFQEPKDWRKGTGYPAINAPDDVWEQEFLGRGPSGLSGRPHFKLGNGKVEFFRGPAILPIEQDGSLNLSADGVRSGTTSMVIEFFLEHDIGPQINRARRWLVGSQSDRFESHERRLQVTKYQFYLRALDAVVEGVTQDGIAAVLYPHLQNSLGEFRGRKQVQNDLKAARKLVNEGIKPSFKRK